MVSCCNSKTEAKKCNRKTDNKTFKLPRKYSIEECREGIDGFSKRSSCAPFKGCRGISISGGMRKNRTNRGRTRRTNRRINRRRTRRTTRRTRRTNRRRTNRRGLLPQLKPISYKNKKHKYKLSDTTKKRRMAIDEGILYESKKKGMNKKKAALSKKSRFNILRIYRRNNHKDQCLILTKDMKYIDRKYGLGNTKNIC
jgi:hypothetical protein